MHLAVLFYNIGGYHLARLDAAHRACLERGWSLSAIQMAGTTNDHPWGNFDLTDYIHTLSDDDRHFSSKHCLPSLQKVLDQLSPTSTGHSRMGI